MKVITLFFVLLVFTALAGVLAFQPEKLPKTKALLGKKLFFDPILSENHTISCASCHKPQFAFADTARFSQGIYGHLTTRNTPSSMNVRGRTSLFWDGRVKSLEEQALAPLVHPNEMGLPLAEAVKRLNADVFYQKAFKKLFKSGATQENLAIALAEFQRSLETGNSAFDRFIHDNDQKAITESAKRGRMIFIEKAKCFDCHFGLDFTGDEFMNIGLYNGKELNDPGRFGIVKDSAYLGSFKVPGLRNIAITAPYMHNGMFKTLREVVDYYDDPNKFVQGSLNRDELLRKPLGLTVNEKEDLVAFLESLTDETFVK
ncbi:MAG: c-type cytochrome [Verrucomicrobia bacterium]|nr:c-type cytochrome [Cytophagales bacterium]